MSSTKASSAFPATIGHPHGILLPGVLGGLPCPRSASTRSPRGKTAGEPGEPGEPGHMSHRSPMQACPHASRSQIFCPGVLCHGGDHRRWGLSLSPCREGSAPGAAPPARPAARRVGMAESQVVLVTRLASTTCFHNLLPQQYSLLSHQLECYVSFRGQSPGQYHPGEDVPFFRRCVQLHQR